MPKTAAPAPAEMAGPADIDLATAAAAGEKGAFEELYRRNVPAAWRVAQAVAHNRDDASDAVADAFERVLRAVTTGRLCESGSFRPYLLTATRRAAIDISRRSRRCESSDDVEAMIPATVKAEPADHVVADVEAEMLIRAFRTLPERWRTVLWLIEVEDLSAQEAAGVLGLKPNNVAQLVVRARAGLRKQYLIAHVDGHARPECTVVIERLGTYLEGGLGRRRADRIGEHLAACDACRRRLDDLRDLGVTLRRSALPIPVLLGSLVANEWRRLGARPSFVRPRLGAIRELPRPAPRGAPSAFAGSGPVGGWVSNVAPHVAAAAPATERMLAWASTGLLVLGVSVSLARSDGPAAGGTAPPARSAEATTEGPIASGRAWPGHGTSSGLAGPPPNATGEHGPGAASVGGATAGSGEPDTPPLSAALGALPPVPTVDSLLPPLSPVTSALPPLPALPPVVSALPTLPTLPTSETTLPPLPRLPPLPTAEPTRPLPAEPTLSPVPAAEPALKQLPRSSTAETTDLPLPLPPLPAAEPR